MEEVYNTLISSDRGSLIQYANDFIRIKRINIDRYLIIDGTLYLPLFNGDVVKIKKEHKDLFIEPVAFSEFIWLYRQNHPEVKIVIDLCAGNTPWRTKGYFRLLYPEEENLFIIAADYNHNYILQAFEEERGPLTFIQQSYVEFSSNFQEREIFDHVAFLLPPIPGLSREREAYDIFKDKLLVAIINAPKCMRKKGSVNFLLEEHSSVPAFLTRYFGFSVTHLLQGDFMQYDQDQDDEGWGRPADLFRFQHELLGNRSTVHRQPRVLNSSL